MTTEIDADGLAAAAEAIDTLWSDGQDRGPAFADTEREYQEHCRSTARAAITAYLATARTSEAEPVACADCGAKDPFMYPCHQQGCPHSPTPASDDHVEAVLPEWATDKHIAEGVLERAETFGQLCRPRHPRPSPPPGYDRQAWERVMTLDKLTPAALSAAMRGGTLDWGQHGNAVTHVRYAQEIVGRRGRRKCHCGCGRRSTHLGMANGVCLTSGCELSVRRWVKDPFWQYRRTPTSPS